MLYIAENLKRLRRAHELTQEDVAAILAVSPQSVSKWERGDNYPDITLLPALANLFSVSVDELLGMARINDVTAQNAVLTLAHEHMRSYEYERAAELYTDALRTFPNDAGLMSDLAIALTLIGGAANLERTRTLCERVLEDVPNRKVHHTTRAALCLVHAKLGEHSAALETAQNLPHVRESREHIAAQIEKYALDTDAERIDQFLRFIGLGEETQ